MTYQLKCNTKENNKIDQTYRADVWNSAVEKGLSPEIMLDSILKNYQYNHVAIKKKNAAYVAYLNPEEYDYIDQKTIEKTLWTSIFDKNHTKTVPFLIIYADDKEKLKKFMEDFSIDPTSISIASWIQVCKAYFVVFGLNHHITYSTYKQIEEYINYLGCIKTHEYGFLKVKETLNIACDFPDRHLNINLDETKRLDTVAKWVKQSMSCGAKINVNSFISKLETLSNEAKSIVEKYKEKEKLSDEEVKKIETFINNHTESPIGNYTTNIEEYKTWKNTMCTLALKIYSKLSEKAQTSTKDFVEIDFNISDVVAILKAKNIQQRFKPSTILTRLYTIFTENNLVESWNLQSGKISAKRLPGGYIKICEPTDQFKLNDVVEHAELLDELEW